MTSFKKTLSSLGICLAVLAAANVNAADQATLSVVGKIVPGACVPSLDQGGVVDYGTINNKVIDSASAGNSLVQLDHKNITLTISCDSATTVGVIAQDNRADSKVDLSETSFIDNYYGNNDLMTTSAAFGLGTTDGGVKIGAYSITAGSQGMTADGQAVSPIVKDTDVNGAKWISTAGGLFYPDGTRIVTAAETGSTTPKYFSELIMPLTIATAVQTKSALNNASLIELNGNATLSLVYL